MTDTKRLRELAEIFLSVKRVHDEEFRSLILAACEELEAAREDARRYRFLRDNDPDAKKYAAALDKICQGSDTVIDEAMK